MSIRAVPPQPTSAAPAPVTGATDGGWLSCLERHPRVAPFVRHVASLPRQEARTGRLDRPLPPALAAGLERLGVPGLWSHQAEALAAVRCGEDVLVTTPTASGKSLIFHLPVAEEALAGGPGRALFLYPLKALGQDQKGKLDELFLAAGLPPSCEIYDGDTPPSRRARIRRKPPRVVISNPDMLHLGILPSWTSWEPFLRDLRWIVLDELHAYRGIFGSHFHHVLQRLLRVCRELGASPRVVASSATAANAGEFAATLLDRPFHWVRESGAPREGRHFVLLQPEASPYTLALQLLVELLRQGAKTIVFTKARRITELLFRWLGQQEPELARRVAGYRAGFLPEERRRIEADLFSGKLQGVISTSALEMGIDVGGLDACVLVGYPGSVMATWQRSGRVGRDGRDSLTALVALPDALDQYLLRHPEALLERPCEQLVADPANEVVAGRHLVCAAAELPLRPERDAGYLAAQETAVADLLRRHELREAADGSAIYARRRRPHREVELRGGGAGHAIVDVRRGRTIGTVDGARVFHECHPGAVYLHAGRQYQVTQLRLGDRTVLVEPVDLDWFTSALAEKQTEVLSVHEEMHVGPLSAWLGRLRVTERVVGYERKRVFGQEVLGRETLELPPSTYETVGLWWAASPALQEELERRHRHVLGSLHAAEHAAISLLPLLALCDRGDIGGISMPFHPQLGCGAVFVYDGHPGGIGLAARAFRELPDLLGRVAALLAECGCEEGCPACVQSPKCGNGNRPLDKAGAELAMRLLLGSEPGGGEGWPGEDLPRGTQEKPLETDPWDEDGPPWEEDALVAVAATAPPASPAVAVVPGRPARTIVFDLETLRSAADVGGWHRTYRMGLAMGVVCHLEEDRFEIFGEGEVRGLVAALRGADLVVGFNLKRFDYRVLSGYTGADYERLLPTLDLLEEVYRSLGFRLRLDHLATETLGAGKSADGLQCLEWVRAGRYDLVESYCRRDVEVLRDLYLFGRREGFVCYRDKQERRLKLPVEW